MIHEDILSSALIKNTYPEGGVFQSVLKISKQEDHDILLHPIVKNTGNVSVDANVKIVTRSALGYLVSENGGKYPILRGDTSEWNFEVKKPFWGGWYRSTLSVSYDENSGAGIGIDSGERLTDLGGKTVWFFSLPSLLAGLIEVLVLLAVAWGVRAYLVARLVKNWIKKTWVEYEVRSEEDINSIASRYGISWKVLAKVNKLKPPFALRAGDRIKVPPGRVN